MWNYIKYVLKLCIGAMIIVALNTILKKADPFIGDLWWYITVILYVGYCLIDYYTLMDKEDWMMPETVQNPPTPFSFWCRKFFRPTDFVRYMGSYLMGHIMSIPKKGCLFHLFILSLYRYVRKRICPLRRSIGA